MNHTHVEAKKPDTHVEILKVDPNNKHTCRLFDKAYESIFKRAFPLPGEASLRHLKDTFEGTIPGVSGRGLVIGFNLSDPDNHVIAGLGTACYYNHGLNSGLLGYNAVDEAFRGRGYAKIIVEARWKDLNELAQKHGHQQVGGPFLEVNKKTTLKDSFDPVARQNIFKGYGAKIVPIDYTSPPLALGEPYIIHLDLMTYGTPNPRETRNYIRATFRESRVKDSKTNPHFLAMMDQVTQWERNPTAWENAWWTKRAANEPPSSSLPAPRVKLA